MLEKKELFETIAKLYNAHYRKNYGQVKSEVKVFYPEGRVLKVTYTGREHSKGETLSLEIFAYGHSRGKRKFTTMEEYESIVKEVTSQDFRF